MLIKIKAFRRWMVIGGTLLLVSPVFSLFAPSGADSVSGTPGLTCLHAEETAEVERAAQAIHSDGLIVLKPIAPSLGRQERTLAWDALDDARAIWSRSLELETPMAADEGAEKPDVRVEFVRQAILSGEHVAGYIRWCRRADRERISIVVGMRDRQGRPLSKSAIVSALSHELGHALGLSDDPASSGVMARIDPENPTTAPSEPEIHAALAIRRRAILPAMPAKVESLGGSPARKKHGR